MFSIGPELSFQTPAVISPANNTLMSGAVTISANNAPRTGVANSVTYKFDVADGSDFGHIVFTASVAEQGGAGGVTSVTIPARTIPSGTYFVRVQATDSPTGIASPVSGVTFFRYTSFNMADATVYSSPSDLGKWIETSTITLIQTSGQYVIVDHTKRTGPNKWHEEPFGDGGIQYTLGMCVNLNGSGNWACSAVIQFWEGRELTAGGGVDEIGSNWFYDARWGPLMGHQPARGEVVGMFVGAGNLRGRTDPSYVTCITECERSNVVLIPWGTDYVGSPSLLKTPISALMPRQ
jgi:hypothetical protein